MNNRPNILKRQLLIDKSIQLPLLFYFVISSIIGVLAFAASSFAITIFVYYGINQTWGLTILILTLFASLGLFVYLVLFLTNKIAGPIYRLRMNLKSIADGNAPELMVMRNDDFTDEVIEEYNRMVETLSKERARRAP